MITRMKHAALKFVVIIVVIGDVNILANDVLGTRQIHFPQPKNTCTTTKMVLKLSFYAYFFPERNKVTLITGTKCGIKSATTRKTGAGKCNKAANIG